MRQSMEGRLTYANVVATLALFLALGGGAYAATKLPANSVGSTQIKKNAVTSKKVKNASLLATDFKAGQLPAGQNGAPGPRGAQGAQGAQGAPGSARAYADVIPNCVGGVFPVGVCDTDAAHTKGVSAVVRVETGVYCIAAPGISSANVVPVASVNQYNTGGGFSSPNVWVSTGTSDCPRASDFKVITARDNGVNNGTFDNSTAFVIVIP